ncbi:hypothetical protein [Nocardia sp. CY41]|uniref:hypothetical protein n=1 Tax=Nocardia sp. CY41 TaxID=2608686 RepID=UPI001356BA5A|nr:hypothetical protein [Nocardia sp. CY41]
MGGLVATMSVVGCDTGDGPPAGFPSDATTSPVAPLPPQPWTPAELTYHPCSVLGPDDVARYVLAIRRIVLSGNRRIRDSDGRRLGRVRQNRRRRHHYRRTPALTGDCGAWCSIGLRQTMRLPPDLDALLHPAA